MKASKAFRHICASASPQPPVSGRSPPVGHTTTAALPEPLQHADHAGGEVHPGPIFIKKLKLQKFESANENIGYI